MRPCTCDRFHAPYQQGDCRLCFLYHHDPRYKTLWNGQPERPAPQPRTAACRHRGTEQGQADCPSCRGTVRVKVFACTLHASCTLARVVPGHACCESCKDYQP